MYLVKFKNEVRRKNPSFWQFYFRVTDFLFIEQRRGGEERQEEGKRIQTLQVEFFGFLDQ